MSKTNLYIVKIEQPKLLKVLESQGIVSDVIKLTPATTTTTHRRGRKAGRGPGRPPKA